MDWFQIEVPDWDSSNKKEVNFKISNSKVKVKASPEEKKKNLKQKGDDDESWLKELEKSVRGSSQNDQSKKQKVPSAQKDTNNDLKRKREDQNEENTKKRSKSAEQPIVSEEKTKKIKISPSTQQSVEETNKKQKPAQDENKSKPETKSKKVPVVEKKENTKPKKENPEKVLENPENNQKKAKQNKKLSKVYFNILNSPKDEKDSEELQKILNEATQIPKESQKKKKKKKKKQNAKESEENQKSIPQNEKEEEKEEEIEKKEVQKQKLPYSKTLEENKEKLKASQFRWLNEKLYTTTGKEALDLFQKNSDLFKYHDGFKHQVEKWPINPIDVIIDFVKSKPSTMIVADFGCGEAKLARKVKNKVHSFDLYAVNKLVTVCDVTHTPLENASVDIAVFSLSLMGTNFVDFLVEANRVLKPNGILKIAEVKSRFEDKIDQFPKILYELGFDFVSKDDSNKMFVLFEFKKSNRKIGNKNIKYQLKPCQYKKR